MEEKILFRPDMEELLGVSGRQVDELDKSGKMPCSRFPGTRKKYWLLSSVLERLKQNEGVQLKYKKRK